MVFYSFLFVCFFGLLNFAFLVKKVHRDFLWKFMEVFWGILWVFGEFFGFWGIKVSDSEVIWQGKRCFCSFTVKHCQGTVHKLSSMTLEQSFTIFCWNSRSPSCHPHISPEKSKIKRPWPLPFIDHSKLFSNQHNFQP